jgi:hypothetical protein
MRINTSFQELLDAGERLSDVAIAKNGRSFSEVWTDGTIISIGEGIGIAGSELRLSPGEVVTTLALAPNGAAYRFSNLGHVYPTDGAPFHGDMRGTPLQGGVIAAEVTPSGEGYWMVGADGGVFSFGDASFYGSTGGIRLNRPVVDMATSPTGEGYWLVASDGGIFAFGDARFYGSAGSIALNRPAVTMVPYGNTAYHIIAEDGGVFTYGNAPFLNSLGRYPTVTAAPGYEITTGDSYAPPAIPTGENEDSGDDGEQPPYQKPFQIVASPMGWIYGFSTDTLPQEISYWGHELSVFVP